MINAPYSFKGVGLLLLFLLLYLLCLWSSRANDKCTIQFQGSRAFHFFFFLCIYSVYGLPELMINAPYSFKGVGLFTSFSSSVFTLFMVFQS